ncbi:glutathione peroxidase [Microbacterium sp. cf046]|uniref:glutathione peroxidase n=1 Tax=Microbacterium sp. cf046 TaxID=1761803 RepID=UPI0008E05634|nr:glutathione peroxidase [Microbacterium sp. cf046]SFS05394.1 glutathione peroxidase [Microbacterium sp. cf046]
MTESTAIDIRNIPFTTADGQEVSLAEYEGQVLLIVNVASRCGLTPQYEQLEQLKKTYGPRGFDVLAFPSNQFLQELSSMDDILEYCSTTWGVTFPVFEKVRVNGKKAAPLFKELTKTEDADGRSGRVEWNFEKFLVLPDGRVKRFRPKMRPDDPQIVELIEANLPN